MSWSCRAHGAGWPLERALFALAGTAALLSALLAATVSPRFLALTAFGVCPASVVVERVAHRRSAIYTDEEVRGR